ncbi:MAG TPA: biopolymer transporter ExbD [Paraburkholderia sp.]|jgi:biopolymer transport protein ExbD
MRVQDEEKPYDDINITPMLDLAYVLLIIFIIMTTASVQGIKVDLPKASSSASLAKPQTKAITVSDSGQIYLDAYPVSMDELENRLRTIKATTPDVPIVLKGDSTVAYQRVMDVLDLLRRLDLSQVGLVTGKGPQSGNAGS